MEGRPLLIACKVPYTGPPVPVGGLRGVVAVRGIGVGDSVYIHGRNGGQTVDTLCTFQTDGEVQLALAGYYYLQASRSGESGQEVTVWAS